MRCLTTVLLLALLMGLGCEQKKHTPTPGNVAVVDIDEIALATGFDKVLGEQMTQINQQISERLQQVQKQIQSQLDSKQKEFGKAPTPEQSDELQKLSMQLDQQYRNELNKAQQSSNQAHTAMVGQFRQKVDPIAMEVARERGFDIVISRSESMLMVAARANITQEVLTRFMKSAPSQALGIGENRSMTAPAPTMIPGNTPVPDQPQPTTPDAGTQGQQLDVAVPDTLPVQ